MRRFSQLATLSLVTIVAAAGCRHADLAERRTAERLDALERTVGVWADSEAARPSRLRHAAEFVRDDEAARRERLARDVRWVGDWVERDADRLAERQPVYRRKAGEILCGKPERIEPTAIKLFY